MDAESIVDALLEVGTSRRSFLKTVGAGLTAAAFAPASTVGKVAQSAARVAAPARRSGGYFLYGLDAAGRGVISNDGVNYRYADNEEPARLAEPAKRQKQKAPQQKATVQPPVHGRSERDLPMQRVPESVAVDLDGTLARDSGWKGPEHIGEPIKPMVDLVQKLLDDGEEVVIFTARCHDGKSSTKDYVKQWLKDNGLPDLEVTNEKRPDMEKFYDDKAVEVETNKGISKD